MLSNCSLSQKKSIGFFHTQKNSEKTQKNSEEKYGHRWIIFQSSQSCTWQDLVLIHAGDAFNPWWPFRSMLTLDHWTMGAMDHSKTTSSYHSLCLCSLLSGAASWTLTSLPRFLWELPPMLGWRIVRLRLHGSMAPILVVSTFDAPDQLHVAWTRRDQCSNVPSAVCIHAGIIG